MPRATRKAAYASGDYGDQEGMCNLTSMFAATYAPMPQNAAWPREYAAEAHYHVKGDGQVP